MKETCWILHPELKNKFHESSRGQFRPVYTPKANQASCSSSNSQDLNNFTANPINLINEFAAFIQQRQGNCDSEGATAMLGKFTGYLADSNIAGQ